MTDSAVLLRLLQDGDSFFPSGAVSFSWGLETLCNEGIIDGESALEAFILAQLTQRWASFDRAILVATAEVSNSIDAVAQIDRLVEAQTLAEELRTGSRRNGNGLLSAHAKLGTAGAQDYQSLVRQGKGSGHLAPMQGFLWARRGMAANQATALSAHALCVGLLGAAVRIGITGHVGVQKLLSRCHPVISDLMQLPVPCLDDIHAFMPQAEIASMRHEVAPMRLFAN